MTQRWIMLNTIDTKLNSTYHHKKYFTGVDEWVGLNLGQNERTREKDK